MHTICAHHCTICAHHFFDIWHISMLVVSFRLDVVLIYVYIYKIQNYNLMLWRPAIIKHLYWTAASIANGGPNVMEAKKQSMVNHVQDTHEHGTSAFYCCAGRSSWNLLLYTLHSMWLDIKVVHLHGACWCLVYCSSSALEPYNIPVINVRARPYITQSVLRIA